MNNSARAIVLCSVVVLFSQLTACSTQGGHDEHIVDLGGVDHRQGGTDPLVNCVFCHGADLQGHTGPSCYTCHNSTDHATTYGSGGIRHNQPQVDCTRCHGPAGRGGLGPGCMSASCHRRQPL